MSVETHELLAVGPLDGRYAPKVEELSEITSEFGLMRYRVQVEAEWLRTLAGGEVLPNVRKFTDEEDRTVASLARNFRIADAVRVKEIEAETNHDVKAVEIWMRETLLDAGDFEDHLEYIHFGCTSEDINNMAYALMLRDARDKVMLPAIHAIGEDLEGKAHDFAHLPLLSRTHGQPATPTTLGKEMAVFGQRLSISAKALAGLAIYGKFNGATGTYGAHVIAYPEVDWHEVSRAFVESFGFTHQPITTQIEPHDYMARMMNELVVINSQLTDLSFDVWDYIRDEILGIEVVVGETGSSTMPHKVNPIDFENAKGNFGLAIAVAQHLAVDLTRSRLQRDLSDSTAQRAFGEVFGHTLIALKALKKGLGKVPENEPRMREMLENQWAVLGEALQTVMRKNGVRDAFNIIKRETREDGLTKEKYLALVEEYVKDPEDRDRLLALTPATYVGLAEELAKSFRYSRGQ